MLPVAKENPEILRANKNGVPNDSIGSFALVLENEGERAKMTIPTLEDFLYLDIIKSKAFLMNDVVDAASNFSLKDPLFELKKPAEEIKSDEDNTCPQCTHPFNKKNRKCWYDNLINKAFF